MITALGIFSILLALYQSIGFFFDSGMALVQDVAVTLLCVLVAVRCFIGAVA
jgi:hypothetical protein